MSIIYTNVFRIQGICLVLYIISIIYSISRVGTYFITLKSFGYFSKRFKRGNALLPLLDMYYLFYKRFIIVVFLSVCLKP